MSKDIAIPADRIALIRLLASGRSYADVAAALVLDEVSVRDSARTSISTLAGASGEQLTESERGRVADWLLGQTDSDPLIPGSPSAVEFARNARAQALTLSSIELRELPGRTSRGSKERSFVAQVSESPAQATSASKPTAPAIGAVSVAAGAPEASSPRGASSRKGGIALIAALALAAVLGTLWFSGAFDSGSDPKPAPAGQSDPAGNGTTTGDLPTGGNSNGWKLGKTFPMKSPSGGKAQGAAAVSTKQGRSALLVAGNSLPARSWVGTWLVSGRSSTLVSLNLTDAKGAFVLVAPMPAVAASASAIAITKEPFTPGGARPTTPGPVLLSSPFSL